MIKPLLNVIRMTRTKHLFNAVLSPSHAVWAFKYHYRRVSDRDFVTFLAKENGCFINEVNGAYRDLDCNSPVWEEIRNKLLVFSDGYGLQMTRELPVLYLLIRLIKPDNVVETGVASGASSSYILQAMSDNQKGRLDSIDIGPSDFPEGKQLGFVVPDNLRQRWHLHLGDARDLLEPLLNRIGPIDCFIHDSLHTYEHMLWEFRTVWKHLCPKGLFLSHDVGANRAFFDFMKETGISWKDYRVFHVLGGFKKPQMSMRFQIPPEYQSGV